MKDILKSNNLDKYLRDNQSYLIDLSIQDFLNKYIKEKNLVKSQILKNAEMNEIYGYQIFSGSRTPSRDKLLALCIGMGMTLEETQGALKIAGFASLYPKSKRDSIIIHGINQGNTIIEINNLLYDNGEKTL